MKKSPESSPLIQLNVLVPAALVASFDEILLDRQRTDPHRVISRSDLVREALAAYAEAHRVTPKSSTPSGSQGG